MDDLINRQAAIEAAEEIIQRDDSRENIVVEVMKVWKTIIEGLPSAQPERNTGEWIGIDDEPYETWECNQCGYVYEEIPSWAPKFCPNCGAEMRGEERH